MKEAAMLRGHEFANHYYTPTAEVGSHMEDDR